MKKMKQIFDDLIAAIETATENENWDDVDDLCDEFSYVVLENKTKFMRYFSNIHDADYEKIINILMALDPYDWHDFLIKQLRKYLKTVKDLTEENEIFNEILFTLANFSDEVEEEELLSRDVQKELALHLEDDNVVFRNLCFKLIIKASSHKSNITLNCLERLKHHEDWRIQLKAYQAKNMIMEWKKNHGVPLKLRIRQWLPF
jgi:hypothetical protein